MVNNNEVFLSCAECAIFEPMQPCEACPNYRSKQDEQ